MLDAGPGPYVAISEIAVPAEGADALEEAFRSRLGAVDAWPGFLGLEVLRHRRKVGCYLMISRWATKQAFAEYMRSADHRRSHDRIPSGEHAPRPAGFDRPATFRNHVEYCHRLFADRSLPRPWLDDAWRTIDAVLVDELPPDAHRPALELLHAVTR